MFPFYITFYLDFCCTNRSFTPAFTRKWGLSSSFTRMIILDNSCWHISDIKTKFARISWIEVFKPFQFPVEEEQMLSMVFVVADNQQLVNSKPPISLYQVKNSSLSNRQLLFFFIITSYLYFTEEKRNCISPSDFSCVPAPLILGYISPVPISQNNLIYFIWFNSIFALQNLSVQQRRRKDSMDY